MTITLTDELAALVTAYCERSGLTREAAVDDLVRRGFAHLELRQMREDVADLRAAVLDLVAGQDALAPYSVALLSILAHWGVKSGGTTLGEEEYQQIALDTARTIWDALLSERGVPIPDRPPFEAAPPRS